MSTTTAALGTYRWVRDLESNKAVPGLMPHETGALDRRITLPRHYRPPYHGDGKLLHDQHTTRLVPSPGKGVGKGRFLPHQVHHSDLGWGSLGSRQQAPIGQLLRNTERGIKYGESMVYATVRSKTHASDLGR